MPRALPILLMQQVGLPGPDWAAAFEADLRLRLAEFPQTQLVLYPELHLCPPATVADMHRRAEPISGPRIAFLQRMAGEFGVWLVPGSVYESDGEGTPAKVFNTAVAISPDGTLVARYRKCFPWRPWEQVSPGREFVVFDIPGLTRIGLSICYDTWFPEVARHLAWMGAEVILQPTLTATADRAQELVLSQAAAIANQVFVVSVNAAAPQATGQSMVVDPEGHVLLQAGDGPAALTHVLLLDQVDVTRQYGTAGMNRLWSQFTESDDAVLLPAYGGRLDPREWRPGSRDN
jgi:predicted amidohydrolase